MAVDITMPQLSDTMSEGTILNWLKQEGDTVKRGEALAEVATDKADLEIESFHEGTLLKICAPKGTTVKVGSIIAVVGEKGAGAGTAAPVAPQASSEPAALASAGSASPASASPSTGPAFSAAPSDQPASSQSVSFSPSPASVGSMTTIEPSSTSMPRPSTPSQSNGNGIAMPDGGDSDRLKVSPLARNLASNLGVDLGGVSGTGEGGRIVKRDIEKAVGRDLGGPEDSQQAERQQAPGSSPIQTEAKTGMPTRTPMAEGTVATEQLSRMRQTIAARMVESTTTIPHFYVTSRVIVDALSKMRQSLKPLPQYEGLTYNHLIVKASALALRVVPRINAAFQNNSLIQPSSVNIGIVTAVPDGLLIPVLKGADHLSLADIVAEGRALVQRARSGRPKADDLVGGTFSISNMGIFGVESFTAIISPGQGAILAVSPIQEEAIVVEGQLKVGSVMRLSLSVDHRIIDGVIAGEFLTELKRLLEDPVLLLA